MYNKFFISKVLTVVFVLISTLNFGQNKKTSIDELERKLDSLFRNVMENEHIPGAAFIIVKDGKTLLKKGYGYTSLGEEIRRVNPDSTIFRIGSITKTFTATALLQLVDQDKIKLNQDVNLYLNEVKVPKTYKEFVTSAQLLNHSAGFDELRGRVVYNQNDIVPLNTYLKTNLVRIRKPGIVSSYSSFGIALAGLLVEDVSGLTLENYMEKNIWKPLGMEMTSMGLNDQVENFATWGYEYRNGINLPQPWEYYHTYPASEINSTVADMGKYMQMHLNNGILNGKRILSSKLSQAMKNKQLSINPKVESFGYGFYEDFIEDVRAISHGGDMLGYSGYMALIPELNLGVYAVHHHEGTRLRYQVSNLVIQHFNKKTIKDKEEKITKIKTDLTKFSGIYKWSTYCHTCTNSWQPSEEKLVVDHKNFTFKFLNRTYYQIEPFLFKSEDGLRTMAFMEDENGKISYMSLGSSNMFEKIK